MTDTDRLTEELRRQAQARARSLTDQHPLSLDDVRGRARGIRRRRYAVTGLAAAAVVAVTVPLGVAVTDRLDRTPTHGPADGHTDHQTRLVHPSPTPTPTLPRRLALTSDVPQAASAVAVPYLSGKTLYSADGESVTVDRASDVLLPLGPVMSSATPMPRPPTSTGPAPPR